MTQDQILSADIIRIVWQAVRRIMNEILGVKGLTVLIQLMVINFFFMCKLFLTKWICTDNTNLI